MDPLGTVLFMAAILCLLLALQWGGSTYAWGNSRIIILFLLSALCLIAWAISQARLPENAIVPPRISLQRSMAFGSLFSVLFGGSMMMVILYLSIWFQAIRGFSPLKAGVQTISMVIPQVFAGLVAGKVVQVTGLYNPFMIGSSVLLSIGAGLFTTLTPSTPRAAWAGYQVIFGLGLGSGFSQPSLAAQNVLPGRDAPVGVSIILLMITLGGSIFSSVAQTVFANKLVKGTANIPGIDPKTIIHTGATNFRKLIAPEYLDDVVHAYNDAVVDVFQIVIVCACISMVGALGMEWKNLLGKKKEDVEAQVPVTETEVMGTEAGRALTETNGKESAGKAEKV